MTRWKVPERLAAWRRAVRRVVRATRARLMAQERRDALTDDSTTSVREEAQDRVDVAVERERRAGQDEANAAQRFHDARDDAMREHAAREHRAPD